MPIFREQRQQQKAPETVFKNGRLYIKSQDGNLQLVPFGMDDAKAMKATQEAVKEPEKEETKQAQTLDEKKEDRGVDLFEQAEKDEREFGLSGSTGNVNPDFDDHIVMPEEEVDPLACLENYDPVSQELGGVAERSDGFAGHEEIEDR